MPILYRPAHAAGAPRNLGHILQRLLVAPVFSAVCLLVLLLMLAVPAAHGQAPKPIADYVPKLTAYPETDRSSWIEYSTSAGVKHTLETSLDQQTWTVVDAGSVYGTGAQVKVRVKDPTVLLQGEPSPLPPHPVYRYFVMAVGNGQAHVTGFPRQGQQAFYRLISWPFAQSAFPGIGVYGSVIEPKAGYPSVANVPYQVLFDAWSVTPDVTALPITASLTAQQQTMMDALTNAMPWIEHDLNVNPPLVNYGPPQPFQAVTAEQRNYFRVRVQFQDSDSDGVQDHIELEDGSNPFLSDTDGDGLSDSAEKTAGSNSSSYDLPEITLESRTRSVLVEDVRDAFAPTVMASYGSAPAVKVESVPASLRYSSGTVAGQFNPVLVAQHFTPLAGWSDWQEADGSERTVFNIFRHKDAAGTLLTHTIEIREFQMRLKSSRPLPHGWNAVVQTTARSRLNTGVWSSPQSSVYPAGIVGNDYLKLQITANGTVSPDYHFYVLPYENNENKQTMLTWFRPRIADGTPGNTYGTPGTLNPLTQVFAPVTFAGDTDKDGVPPAAEDALLMDNTKWNSRGSDTPDCNRPVRGLAGPNVKAVVQERSLDWDRIPYSSDKKELAKATAHWKGNAEATWSSTTLVTNPPGITTQLTSLMPFDTTPTAPEESMSLSAGGELTAIGAGSGQCHHARLTHKRVRLVMHPAPKKITKLTYLLITERKQGSSSEVVSAEPVTFTFDANSELSDYYEIKPSFTATGFTGAPSGGTLEKVTATLAAVEWVFAKGQDKDLPRQSIPYWTPNSANLDQKKIPELAASKLRIRHSKLPTEYLTLSIKTSANDVLTSDLAMVQQGKGFVSDKPVVLLPDYGDESKMLQGERDSNYILFLPGANSLNWRSMPQLGMAQTGGSGGVPLPAAVPITAPVMCMKCFGPVDSARTPDLWDLIGDSGVADGYFQEKLKYTVEADESTSGDEMFAGGFLSGKGVLYFYGHGIVSSGAIPWAGFHVPGVAPAAVTGDILGIQDRNGVRVGPLDFRSPATGKLAPDAKAVFVAACGSALTGLDATVAGYALLGDSKASDSLSPGAVALATSFGPDAAYFGFGSAIDAVVADTIMKEFLSKAALAGPTARAGTVFAAFRSDYATKPAADQRLLKMYGYDPTNTMAAQGAANDLDNNP